ncbi:MAG TPA: hypothetical protein PK771_13645, partial [Spirochaetota bacterium]|nr:hypothetical protein [Spirochaetota bacterium]
INNNKNLDIIVCFGYKNNDFIMDVEKKQNRIFIEILTDYIKTKREINYKIGIRWDYAIIEALNSKHFSKFVLDNKYEKKIVNYMAKNKNLVYKEDNYDDYFKNTDNTNDSFINNIFKKKGK